MSEEWTCDIPPVSVVRQGFTDSHLDDPHLASFERVLHALRVAGECWEGSRIAVTVGSRGIGGIPDIVRGVVDAVKAVGANPVIVPAMGSHGGSSLEAKCTLLRGLGISEESVRAPITGTNEILKIGQAGPDLPVYCHAEAATAAGVILVNRVKPHTDFRSEIESGLVKMAAVGLGGELGARAVHLRGYPHLPSRIVEVGRAVIRMAPVIMGVAIVEGPTHRPNLIEVIPKARIVEREKELLVQARKMVPRLPFRDLDVLVIGRIGKDVSGLGMDPIVTGRYPSNVVPGDDTPAFKRIAVLGLTAASEGNGSGIGLADVTTERVFSRIRLRDMYRNVITSKGSASGRLPMIMRSDREAICVAILTSAAEPGGARLAIIEDTLAMERFWVSESLLGECISSGAEPEGPPSELRFSASGDLLWPFLARG